MHKVQQVRSTSPCPFSRWCFEARYVAFRQSKEAITVSIHIQLFAERAQFCGRVLPRLEWLSQHAPVLLPAHPSVSALPANVAPVRLLATQKRKGIPPGIACLRQELTLNRISRLSHYRGWTMQQS